jgi:hypothetical protein
LDVKHITLISRDKGRLVFAPPCLPALNAPLIHIILGNRQSEASIVPDSCPRLELRSDGLLRALDIKHITLVSRDKGRLVFVPACLPALNAPLIHIILGNRQFKATCTNPSIETKKHHPDYYPQPGYRGVQNSLSIFCCLSTNTHHPPIYTLCTKSKVTGTDIKV